MIRVLVADDQSVVREGIRILLEPIEEIQTVGFAKNGSEVLELVKKVTPDIVLLDIEMPDIDGLTLTKQITSDFPSIKTIILSTHLSTDYVTKALDSGAKGYISKCAVTQDLSLSIQLVYRGYSSIKHELMTKVLDQKQEKILNYQDQIEELKYEQEINYISSKDNKLKKKSLLLEIVKKITSPINFILQIINTIFSKSIKSLFKCIDRILFNN